MKVYCERASTYCPHDAQIMRLLAAQEATLLANSQSVAEARRLGRRLTEVLATRDAIAQATGVLPGQRMASREPAFAALAATARRGDRSIEDVARALIAVATTRNTGTAAT